MIRRIALALGVVIVVGLVSAAVLLFVGARGRADDADRIRATAARIEDASAGVADEGRALDAQRRNSDAVVRNRERRTQRLVSAAAAVERRLDEVLRASQDLANAQNELTTWANRAVDARNGGRARLAEQILGSGGTKRIQRLTRARDAEDSAATQLDRATKRFLEAAG